MSKWALSLAFVVNKRLFMQGTWRTLPWTLEIPCWILDILKFR
jgi:hypothetical protein